MHRAALLALVLLWSSSPQARVETPDMSLRPQVRSGLEGVDGSGPDAPGVSLALARERVRRVSDVRYRLHFTIPAARETPVTGTVTLRFRLADASRPLALDFAGPSDSLRGARVHGKPANVTVVQEHVILPSDALREGENEVELQFQSSDVPLNRTADFMYSLFVPARARLAFPCFDQPDLKGRYTLSLEVPRGWEALSNGQEGSRTETANGTRLGFLETKPISTYLFALAAGRFEIERAERNGRAFRMLHRETDAAKVARNRDTVFDLHASALAWMEDYTGIPYPFEKFDVLLVPSFQFGGMEHPGAVYYNASALLLDPSATQNQHLGRASLISHETAHMWFGDLVTMPWFTDVWMKEVFANFMAAKIVNPSFPGINHDLRFLYAHYPTAYEVDRTAGSNPIRQPLENLSEAGSLYGAIIYQKAPIVMRQLELILSADGLRDGLRDYLKAHAYGNAAWPDLIRLLDPRTPEDLPAWSRAWVEEAGRPIITTTAVPAGGDGLTLRFDQRDAQVARSLTWSQHLEVALGGQHGMQTVSVPLRSRHAAVTLRHFGAPPPLFVLPTGGGIGYGEFVLDARSREYLSTRLHEVPDALTRGAALVVLWEEMLGGRLPPERLFALLLAALPHESDELNVQRMLSYAVHAFWVFLPDDVREGRAAEFDGLLRAGVERAPSSSLTSTWFNALRDTSSVPATLAWLEEVWTGTRVVPGLTLAEPDYITLAMELAVREVPGWQAILKQQISRTENPDRRAQLTFVMPSLSADPAERLAFFMRLADVRNRSREAWVLQAVGYLHHPLRAAWAEPLITPALRLLREIQQTGDIFFPKRWTDASLRGHRSPAAARRVRSFLDELPENYPERLRRVILSSADDLFRASRLREPE